MSNTIYDFTVKARNGELIDFADFKGKAILVVNVASKCGFTPQYEGLEKLYKSYADKGLVIIAFPCNQFGSQEPDVQTQADCLLNFGVTFPITEIVDVNGSNATPVFVYLKSALPGLLGLNDVKWNFTKFLINPDGSPNKRYSSMDTPESMEKDIKNLLGL